MKFSYKFGLCVSAMTAAMSAGAMAAAITTGTFAADGYITGGTCGAASASLKPKSIIANELILTGANKPAYLITPATTSSAVAGGAQTLTCVSGKLPAAGVAGATLTFACYYDSAKGASSAVLFNLKTTFKVGASHAPGVYQVSTSNALIAGGKTQCTYSADQTAILQ